MVCFELDINETMHIKKTQSKNKIRKNGPSKRVTWALKSTEPNMPHICWIA